MRKENYPDPLGHFEAPWRPLCVLNKVEGGEHTVPGLNLLNGWTNLQPKKSDLKSLRYLGYKFAVISEPSHVTKY